MTLWVHAEIALLTHHELHQSRARPRVIGSSRSACYLCDSFIKAHGQYIVSSTHDTFYTRWTVPDLKAFGDGTRKRFRQAILKTNKDVLTARNAYSKSLLANGPWVNLSVVDVGRQLWSPIASSMVSPAVSHRSCDELSGMRPQVTKAVPEAPLNVQKPSPTVPDRVQTTIESLNDDVVNKKDSSAISISSHERIKADSETRSNMVDDHAGDIFQVQEDSYPIDSISTSRGQASNPRNSRRSSSLTLCSATPISRSILCNRIEIFIEVEEPYKDTMLIINGASVSAISCSTPIEEADIPSLDITQLPSDEPGQCIDLLRSKTGGRALLMYHGSHRIKLSCGIG